VVYDPPIDPAAFYAQTYEEQQKWMSAHSKALDGFQTLRSRLGEKRFRGEYAELFGVAFLVLWVACLGFGFRERRASRSDPRLDRTRTDNARAG
jgi:hypothetical protein